MHQPIPYGTAEYVASGKLEYWAKDGEDKSGRKKVWHNGTLKILGESINMPSDFLEEHGETLKDSVIQVHGELSVRTREGVQLCFRTVKAAYLVTKDGLKPVMGEDGTRRRAAA